MTPLNYKWALVLAIALLSACSETEDAIVAYTPVEQQPVELSGAVAAKGAKNGISQAIGGALQGASQSGAASSVPQAVNPPAEIFADGSTSATAPAYGPSNDDSNASVDLSAWEGPLEGPDGSADWYRRTWTYTYASYATGTSEYVTDTYSYWFRSDPASDFSQGWSNVAAHTIYYAWTAESSIWGDSTWLMSIAFVQPTQNQQGEIVPAAVVGTWSWTVESNSAHHAGSQGTGKFRYSLSLDDDDQNGQGFAALLTSDALQQMEVGDTIKYTSDVTMAWEFDWHVFDYNNVEIADIFGGGGGNAFIAFAVTRESTTAFYLGFDYAGAQTGYIGIGDPDATIDYLAEPEFAQDVTPPGDLWATGYGYHNQTGDEAELRDGLLYWYTYIFDFNQQVRSGAANPESGSYYSKSLVLDAGGKKRESVSCSAPEVSSDCPEDSGQ